MIYLFVIVIFLFAVCLFVCFLKIKHIKEKKKHLYWNHISGFGELECLDCGKKMWIYAFLHGTEDMIIGTQCQNCGTYFGTRIKYSNSKDDKEKDPDAIQASVLSGLDKLKGNVGKKVNGKGAVEDES